MKKLQSLIALLLVVVMVTGMMPVNAVDVVKTRHTGSTTHTNPLYPDAIAPEIPEHPDAYVLNTGKVASCATVEAAADVLREAMENRQETVQFYYAKCESEAAVDTLFQKILDTALAHTGVPTQGDYLQWQYGGVSAVWSYYINSDGSVYDITFSYTVSYYTTAEQEAKMNDAVEDLLDELALSDKTDYEKICGIYDYICDNVVYDNDNLNDDTHKLKFTAYAALINGTSVCQGYSNLFYRLALELGVDNRIIVGNPYGPHSWNLVELDGSYYYLDATWDAGRSAYSYFLLGSSNFCKDHTPESAFISEYPIDTKDYVHSAPDEPEEPEEPENPAEIIDSGTCGTSLTWTLTDDGTLTISGEGEMDDYQWGNAPWYSYCAQITVAVIGDGVTAIGDAAFCYCTNLTNVTISNSVITIGSAVFLGCTSLTSVTIPDGVTRLSEKLFSGCTALVSIDIPDGITKILSECFRDCRELEDVTIPISVKTVNDFAFDGCDSLKTVHYAGSAEEWDLIDIGLRNDPLLEAAIIFAKDSTELGEPGEIIVSGTCGENLTWTLTENGFLTISGEGEMVDFGGTDREYETAPWSNYGKSIFVVIVEDGVTHLGNYAFSFSYQNIRRVELPDSMISIGHHAFVDCESLLDVTLPASLVSIGDLAFYDCANLRTLTLPGTVTDIGNYAFAGCKKLTEIVIPDGVTSAGANLFSGCGRLESVTLPEGLTSISSQMFYFCESLRSITIPDSVTRIEDEAFYGCEVLETLAISANVSFIGNSVFAGCYELTGIHVDSTNEYYCSVDGVLFSKDMTRLICHPGAKSSANNYVIPDGVVTIENRAFDSCRILLGVTIPDSVQNIGEYAFNFCYYLRSVVIPEGVTTINAGTFLACWALREVKIPATVTSIGRNAFNDCSSLENVYFTGIDEQWSAITVGTGNDDLSNAELIYTQTAVRRFLRKQSDLEDR